MSQYNLYCVLKDIIISIYCVSEVEVSDDFRIPLLHFCISCTHVGFILRPTLNGFIPLVNVWGVMDFIMICKI